MNKRIVPYLAGYIILLMMVSALMAIYPKADLHLMLNSFHGPVADIFFRYYTVLAEWPLYVIALIPLLFGKWRWTLFYGISEGVAACIIRIIKEIIHAPRPVAFFEEIEDVTLPLVEGVRMHHSNSFPSGHSSTFFLFFTFSALLITAYRKGTKRTLLLFLAAALGCYSRVYLSQHFLADITVGSIVGVLVACVMFSVFEEKIVRQ